MTITEQIASELNVAPARIQAAIDLLDDGATVPFIARYRKEATGTLDDTQLRVLAERLQYLRELAERKQTILNSIEQQGQLNDDLRRLIEGADNKTTLEDLYLPYRPKRRTKAQMAREAGLLPLAESLLLDPHQVPEQLAQNYINDQVPDAKAALEGARAILMEQFAEDAQLLGALREKLWHHAEIHTCIVAGQEQAGIKFQDYFDYRELINQIPSHRALAILRGRNEGFLSIRLKYQPDDVPITELSEYEQLIVAHMHINYQGRAADQWLHDTVRFSWRAKIFLSLELEALNRLKAQADQAAITIFAQNLRDLLLAAPAGRITTLGLDPGIRTGVKVAVIDDTGKLLETTTIYPHQPRNDWAAAIATLAQLVKRHHIHLIAIGNGTASRETAKLASELIQALPEHNLRKVIVSEAGASIYSASELAAKEFPDLDVSLRGAVSIARRVQDPLAELVKIDPKSIGVGQYQHDVNQIQLAKSLDAVVEDCVNAVGVDVNTASVTLLARISGLNRTLAQNIVQYRDLHGAFNSRQDLHNVPRLGAKTFEQAAGFLRIHHGTEPLDASAVHPECYPIVKRMLANTQLTAHELIGHRQAIATLKPQDYISADFGLLTIKDILAELEKPGRDPRGDFRTAHFQEGINDIKDLQVGMILEGVISNVAAFGAFVDIGVHQDGLVHISALADRYIADPREVVKAGDVVKVKVMEVDCSRQRIALSMCLTQTANATSILPRSAKKSSSASVHKNNAMAEALAKIKT